jgi:hypothetical protein
MTNAVMSQFPSTSPFPRPVHRERVRVRVFGHGRDEARTLTPALSRHTGRGGTIGLFLTVVLSFCASALARDPVPLLTASIDRPLRYQPDGGDFLIVNGTEAFNRPLYTAHTPGRVDAGDRPEFAFCFPTKGGVLRLGIVSAGGAKWLTDAEKIVARYRPGSMIYQITDPLLAGGTFTITALPTQVTAGLVLRVGQEGGQPVDFAWAYGGGTGEGSRTHFDLVGNPDLTPTWALRPSDCAGARVRVSESHYTYKDMTCSAPRGSSLGAADSAQWSSLAGLLASSESNRPVAIGRIALTAGQPIFLSLQRSAAPADPAALFDASERYRQSVAGRVVVDTPDPFINAIPAAMCIAADDIWQPPTFMHGANAWRTPLLGWRGPYALDALGWHDRAEQQFTYWAGRQNISNDFPTAAVADPAKNLAENDWKMLHSNGNIPQTHYDMDLPFIDELYWHFFWTGDVKFVKKMWPVIVRHLAWEKRCFDRDGLYEGYACIWASDGLEYNGGGAAHSTAYNYLHNLLAARMARLIGEDPAPYDAEARRIHAAMQSRLWMPDRGWYAEYQDLLGLQRVHPDAALWTVYHTIDSQVPDPFQAYQTLRYVDTHIPHIPVRGPGVPPGDWYTLSSSDWQPYEWSLNNVCMGEVAHTALAYWQSGRRDEAWKIWKGVILDAMYLGVCPGDLPNLSYYDNYRGESYRDFGDPTGIGSRTFIEGLFGILPDALAGELTIRPGFPADWDHASIRMADVAYSFRREGSVDHFVVKPTFARPMGLHLVLPARGQVAAVMVNGKPSPWQNDESAVGEPRIEIRAAAADQFGVSIQWLGQLPAQSVTSTGAQLRADFAPARLLDVFDPQGALSGIARTDTSMTADMRGSPGYHTAFAKVSQGKLTWWLPVNFEIAPPPPVPPVATAAAPTTFDTIDLTGVLNDKVTQIFLNAYLSPRSPFCSLQIPKQGIGVWSSFSYTVRIDDAGLRRAAGSAGKIVTPTGIPFHTPGDAQARNIAFTSRWDNYPHEITVPVSGTAAHAYLLMAGSTNPMETQIDNGEVIAAYADGTTQRLALRNPDNWWPIDQDYLADDYSFRRNFPTPTRLELASGRFYTPTSDGAKIRGGAATVLEMPLDNGKPLKSITVRTLSNEVVIGLMSLTLAR